MAYRTIHDVSSFLTKLGANFAAGSPVKAAERRGLVNNKRNKVDQQNLTSSDIAYVRGGGLMMIQILCKSVRLSYVNKGNLLTYLLTKHCHLQKNYLTTIGPMFLRQLAFDRTIF